MSLPVCRMCRGDTSEAWIVVTVLDDEPVAGLICSTECLIDYAARVASVELEEE